MEFSGYAYPKFYAIAADSSHFGIFKRTRFLHVIFFGLKYFLRTASLLLETMRRLKTTIEDVALSMSYIEVYNEKICDLLQSGENNREIKIIGSKSKSITLDGMTKLPVESFEQFRKYFLTADKKRSVASTRCNSESSRSHAILIRVQKNIKIQKKNLSSKTNICNPCNRHLQYQ